MSPSGRVAIWLSNSYNWHEKKCIAIYKENIDFDRGTTTVKITLNQVTKSAL